MTRVEVQLAQTNGFIVNPLPNVLTSTDPRVSAVLASEKRTAYHRSRKLAAQVLRLLQEFSAGSSNDPRERDLSAIFLADTIKLDVDASRSIEYFDKVIFSIPPQIVNGRNGTSLQYLHFSTKDALPNFHLVPDLEVDIYSGMCLFSSDEIRRSILHVDTELLRGLRPTLYELEFITRSSSAMADLLATFAKGFNSSNLKQLRVVLDIPSFQYYHYLEESVRSGQWKPDQAEEWLEIVERRRLQIAEVFENMVCYQILQRGVNFRPGFIMQRSPELSMIADAIRISLQNGQGPSPNDIWENLDRSKMWRCFKQLLGLNTEPKNFLELANIAHIFEVCQLALRDNTESYWSFVSSTDSQQISRPNTKSSIERRRLIISVDDDIQMRIYKESQWILRKLRRCPDCRVATTLLEAYMLKKILLESKGLNRDLYSGALLAKTVVDEGVDSSAPEQVITEIYGREIVATLKSFLLQAGLVNEN